MYERIVVGVGRRNFGISNPLTRSSQSNKMPTMEPIE
jgi:hypothetical protein